jgi:hypothetical protein
MAAHPDEANEQTSDSPDSGQEKTVNTSPVPSEEQTVDTAAGGSLGQSVGGLAAIILAIVGLAHIFPQYMVAIAALTIGAAFVLAGGNTAMEYSRYLPKTSSGSPRRPSAGSSVSVEVLAGVAGIVLGVLALVTITPTVLLPVAVIVFGAALVASNGDVSRLNALKLDRSSAESRHQQAGRESFSPGDGTRVFIGLVSVVLGILALIGFDWTVLTLVALLIIGVSVLVSSTPLVDRMMTFVSG